MTVAPSSRTVPSGVRPEPAQYRTAERIVAPVGMPVRFSVEVVPTVHWLLAFDWVRKVPEADV